MKLKLISGLIVTILIGFIWIQKSQIEKLDEKLTRTEYNMSQLESENYSLVFKKGELEDYIKQGNTKFKKDIDSVCNQYDIKIKDLNKIISTHTKTVVRDTTYLPSDTVYIKNDSLYVLSFSNKNKCISASVKALTKDPFTKINFELLEADNESYSFVHKQKKKWWQIFKKRKLMMTTIDNCGESQTKELEIQ